MLVIKDKRKLIHLAVGILKSQQLFDPILLFFAQYPLTVQDSIYPRIA